MQHAKHSTSGITYTHQTGANHAYIIRTLTITLTHSERERTLPKLKYIEIMQTVVRLPTNKDTITTNTLCTCIELSRYVPTHKDRLTVNV